MTTGTPSARIPYVSGAEQDAHAARKIVRLSPATIRAAKRAVNRRARRLARTEQADALREHGGEA